MSRQHSEVCPGETCGYCPARIDDAQFPDPGADSDYEFGQSRYEEHLDRMGGSL